MKIEGLKRRYSLGFVLVLLIIAVCIVGVAAYNIGVTSTSGNPEVFGHSVDELDWSVTIPKNVSAVGFCINDDCRTSWPVGNVAKIVAGSGITITPSTGTGEVTISATGGTSQWTASGINIYNTNTGNVGIGIASPTTKLEVNGGIKGTTISGTSISSSGTITASGGITGSSVTGTQICIGTSCKSSWGTTQTCPAGQAIVSVNFATGQATCGSASTSRYWTSIGSYYAFLKTGDTTKYACSSLSTPNSLKMVSVTSCTGGANCDSYAAGTYCMVGSWVGYSSSCGGSSGTMNTANSYILYECK